MSFLTKNTLPFWNWYETLELELQITRQPHHLTLKSMTYQNTWRSDQSTAVSFDFQIINWQQNHLKFKSLDNQIISISNPMTTNSENFRSLDNPINWISDQSTTASLESQMNSENQIKINESQVTWLQLITQPLEFQISWQPNHLNLKSFDIQITWIWEAMDKQTWNQMAIKIIWQPSHLNCNWCQSDIIWFSHQRRAPLSYRFFMVGNFRHRLARSICYIELYRYIGHRPFREKRKEQRNCDKRDCDCESHRVVC